MIKNKPVHIRKYLLPFSWLYGFVVFLRNKFFDWGIFKQHKFDVPIFCVGNITAGGTGKTPHTELLVKLLSEQYRVGVISRGYRRKTKGFVLATSESTALEIGDEPFQIKNKFPDVILAVDSNRKRGISKLLELDTPPEVIVMDDGFQHRYVKPSFSIVLSNYNRPIYKDKLLPAGLLRESTRGLDKASMIIVTKCNDELQPIDYRIITHDIDALPFQELFFSSFKYNKLKPVFNSEIEVKELNYLEDKSVLLVTGIASPTMIVKELDKYTNKVDTLVFKDHYNFKNKDLSKIKKKFDEIPTSNKLILVTEKDAARLLDKQANIDKDLLSSFFSLPIEVKIENGGTEEQFKQIIYGHVKKNRRNS